MNSTHVDKNEKKMSKSLLENGIKVEIVKQGKKVNKQFSPLLRQLVGCCSPLMALVALGSVIGYSATLLSQLKYESSSIQLNASEETWIASIPAISMAIGCILSGILIEKFGRKTIFQIANVPFVIGWMATYFSESVYGLLLGRVLTGFCAGLVSTPVPKYISEITQPYYRGFFLSAQGFAIAFGILIPHAFGLILKWNIIAAICAGIPFLCYMLISMVPESPSWLLNNNQMDKAVKSFTWYRGQYIDSMYEFEKLVEVQKLSRERNDSIRLSNILTIALTKSFYKPLLILLTLTVALQASGLNYVAFYTVKILKDSIGENMNEYVATIILDVIRLLASLVSCVVVKNVGRRHLTAFSGMATTATLIGLSTYLHCASTSEQLKSFYGIPLALYALFIFITAALNSLVWTLTEELFPLKYQGFGSTFVTFVNFAGTFVSVKASPLLFEMLGEQRVYSLFGICCFIGTIIVWIFLPETHNKTLQEIEDIYDNRITIATLKKTKSPKKRLRIAPHHTVINI